MRNKKAVALSGLITKNVNRSAKVGSAVKSEVDAVTKAVGKIVDHILDIDRLTFRIGQHIKNIDTGIGKELTSLNNDMMKYNGKYRDVIKKLKKIPVD